MLIMMAIAMAGFILGVTLAGGVAAFVIGILYHEAAATVDDYRHAASRPAFAGPGGQPGWRPRIVGKENDDA